MAMAITMVTTMAMELAMALAMATGSFSPSRGPRAPNVLHRTAAGRQGRTQRVSNEVRTARTLIRESQEVDVRRYVHRDVRRETRQGDISTGKKRHRLTRADVFSVHRRAMAVCKTASHCRVAYRQPDTVVHGAPRCLHFACTVFSGTRPYTATAARRRTAGGNGQRAAASGRQRTADCGRRRLAGGRQRAAGGRRTE